MKTIEKIDVFKVGTRLPETFGGARSAAGMKGRRRTVVMNGSALVLEHDGRQWVVSSVSPAAFGRSKVA
jgi:hypothetical protein